jgi:5-methylcytosine-specific restriction protein B
MARYTEGHRDKVDETVTLWVKRCLLADDSLTHAEQAGTWSIDNLKELHRRFNGNPLVNGEGGGTFAGKWQIQLEDATPQVRLLAAEILLVHFLFPNSVGRAVKLDGVTATLSTTEFTIDAQSIPALALGQGIAHPGIGFNTRRDLQVGYLIDFARRFKLEDPGQRELLLADPWALRDFADNTDLPLREMRHIVLHLLHPQDYERISSGTHKRQIADAFVDLIDGNPPVDVDETLSAIHQALTISMPKGNTGAAGAIDFYHQPLRGVWESSAGGEGEGTGDLEALSWKKQLIFYGPPGTSKTYQARELAKTIVRREALQRWGFKAYLHCGELLEDLLVTNIFSIQLHPGYGYPEFIRGLRLEGNHTRYQSGLLPHVVARAHAQDLPDGLAPLPVVLVLDEINRTDLSAMFGEAFSLLEAGQRGRTVSLPGINAGDPPDTLALPHDLYLIGTMNEIDHSVETLDFALRRRFLWRECPFERDTLLTIIEHRWPADVGPRFKYEDALDQLSRFADHAENLNRAISASGELGRSYHVGHTYFADISFFLGTWLNGRKSRPPNGGYLWKTAKLGKPQPPLEDLWERSLKPLLEQYLAGADDRDEQMRRLATAYYGQ